MSTLIDIGVACSGAQAPQWWSGNFGKILREVDGGSIRVNKIYAISSALPDANKSDLIGMGLQFASENEKKRNDMTDANRNVIAKNFMASEADWLFTLDDDTVMPDGAISKLLHLNNKFVSGLYYNPNPPKNPLAYLRDPSGFGYVPLYGWVPGSVVQVDSVGMGCTLIHKDVFKAILDAYTVMSRPNGSLFPILKTNVIPGVAPTRFINMPDQFVSDGWMFMKVVAPGDDDNRMWPFFSMEYGRTEDHHFCEMACQVGYHPWVDTTINCAHIKAKAMEYIDYRNFQNEKEGL